MNEYDPQPADTSEVSLPVSLDELRERIAEHVHDVYARGRIDEGWTWGETRNDEKKTNPTLIPYDDLPDSEKNYDRNTAEETLKFIIQAGYSIVPPDSSEATHPIRNFCTLLEASTSLSSFRAFWSSLAPFRRLLTLTQWESLIDNVRKFSDINLWADVATEANKSFAKQFSIVHSLGLAHSQMADKESSLTYALEAIELANTPQDYENAHSLSGKIYKTQWVDNSTEETLDSALQHYQLAYEKGTHSYYPAINIATLQACGGRGDKGKELAESVLKSCEKRSYYWEAATYAEALLLLGRTVEAFDAYKKTFEQYSDVSLRAHGSTRTQARFILGSLGADPDTYDAAIQPPKVIVFAGHMFDSPDRETERFPISLEQYYAGKILSFLKSNNCCALVSSAANGGDTLAAQSAHSLGAQLHIALPCQPDDFIKDSVKHAQHEPCEEQFHQLLKKADSLSVINRFALQEDSLIYSYSNEVMIGKAKLLSTQLGLPLEALTLWDEKPALGNGGTQDFHFKCVEASIPVTNIECLSSSNNTKEHTYSAKPSILNISSNDQAVKGFLFADVKHFSKLTEDQLPVFQNHYMGAISELIEEQDCRPVVMNTWGDAIYMVFDNVSQTGTFALRLRDKLNQEHLKKSTGLPEDLAIRIAVHAGPAYSLLDPITRQFSFTGSHVTYTARMEPITKPSQVYASEAFAALSSLLQHTPFTCQYIGVQPSAKAYGDIALYRLENNS